MSACFVCDFLGFRAHKFPAKYGTKTWTFIADRRSYLMKYLDSNRPRGVISNIEEKLVSIFKNKYSYIEFYLTMMVLTMIKYTQIKNELYIQVFFLICNSLESYVLLYQYKYLKRYFIDFSSMLVLPYKNMLFITDISLNICCQITQFIQLINEIFHFNRNMARTIRN